MQLLDADGRANKLPEEFVISVTPNRPPVVKLERPARDVEVSRLEELQLKWKASDDYGIVRSGVSYVLGGGELREIELHPASQRPAATLSVKQSGPRPLNPQKRGPQVGQAMPDTRIVRHSLTYQSG